MIIDTENLGPDWIDREHAATRHFRAMQNRDLIDFVDGLASDPVREDLSAILARLAPDPAPASGARGQDAHLIGEAA